MIRNTFVAPVSTTVSALTKAVRNALDSILVQLNKQKDIVETASTFPPRPVNGQLVYKEGDGLYVRAEGNWVKLS